MLGQLRQLPLHLGLTQVQHQPPHFPQQPEPVERDLQQHRCRSSRSLDSRARVTARRPKGLAPTPSLKQGQHTQRH
jgi:hypothetical protein